MLKNPRTDPGEFRHRVERDVKWLFILLPLCERLCLLLTFGPIVRANGSVESLAQFVNESAPRYGFTVLQDGGLRHTETGRVFFIHETKTPGEKCVACQVAKNLQLHRHDLRQRIGFLVPRSLRHPGHASEKARLA